MLTLISIILMTIMFTLINHPMSMGMILLVQTILIAMWTGSLSLSYWYSYILFIVMVGGMLILFIYMTSIASNEKFKFNLKMMIFPMLFLIFILMLMSIKDSIMSKIYSMNSDLMMNMKLYLFKMSLNKFIFYPLMIMSMLIIIYLLITLIAVTKITNINIGPLRKTI
uniref:NADH dehydrogenase subunit 6 n=1 Tax=Curtos fulvocapitalis TaxID=1753970 RepID=UPI001D032F68|nr:NADH dehydrogenase subunit 6 [Curtos fulvocapitalis]QVG61309.1 NADH dehydrogenase subunit 6 [Curtos fulvocapitalis]